MNFGNIKSFLPGSRPSFMGISGLSKTWGIAGLVAIGAGLLAYPAFRLYKYLMQKKEKNISNTGNGTVKSFTPAYRGKHKPHHRKAEANDHFNEGLA